MLVGIVLRGSAFTFRTYDSKDDAVQLRWGRIFSVASVATPVVLGLCLCTVTSGRLTFGATLPRSFIERYVMPWATSSFAWSVGALTLALFAFIAATYLTVEARDDTLRNIFRRRALQSQGALVVLAVVTFATARSEAPMVFSGLTRGRVAVAMYVATVLTVVTTVVALRRRRHPLARFAVIAQASFIIWGWAWSQFPWLLPPAHTIAALAAPRITLKLALATLAIGTAILLPSFVYLFRVFKTGESAFERGKR